MGPINETLMYTDEDGLSFEMTIIKNFSFGGKQFVLTAEKEKHHHESGECSCHNHHHNHHDDASQDKPLYVFEWIKESANGKLLAVNDETLQALNPILATL